MKPNNEKQRKFQRMGIYFFVEGDMTIPSYEEMMLPLLKFAGDRREHSIDEAIESIKKTFAITEEESSILLKMAGKAWYLIV